MKKRVASLLLCLVFCLCLLPPISLADEDRFLEINETNFPDPEFRSWIIYSLNVSGDEANGYYMTKAAVDQVTEMEIACISAENVSGIGFFTALKKLRCYNNEHLTALDLSKNTALTELVCDHNQLTSLNVSKNTALTELNCAHNKLTVLDIGNNTALDYLYCSENQLTSLDVSKNTALTSLTCESNQLTQLDVSKNKALKNLGCGVNKLTALDVRANKSLESLYCIMNELKTLDVSQNTALKELACYGTQLTSLDVSKNTALEHLSCGSNNLTALDLSNNTALSSLWCNDNKLTTLDVSKNKALTDLQCYNNQLTSLDLSRNNKLKLEDYSLNGQKPPKQTLVKAGGRYTCDLHALLIDPAKVTVTTDGAVYDPATGVFTFTAWVNSFTYTYDTGNGAMDVTVPTQSQAVATTAPTPTSTPTPAPTASATATAAPTSTPKPTTTPTPAPQESAAKVTKVQAKKSVKLQAPKIKKAAYQWYQRANKNAAWQSLGKKGSKQKLSVKATKALDGYQYRCQVKTATGITYTDIYELYVYEQLKIKKQPKWGKASTPGSKMTLTVTAIGADSYQWLMRPIGSVAWMPIQGATGTSYTVDVQAGMAGYQFACRVTGRQGTIMSKPATVKMAKIPAPKIKKHPVLKKPVAVGSKVTLSVTAQNVETYQWYYRTSANGTWIIMGGETKPTVTITAGAGMNGYQYKCAVKGRGGTADSKVATLKVLGN